MNTKVLLMRALGLATVLLVVASPLSPRVAPAYAGAACPMAQIQSAFAVPHLREAVEHNVQGVVVALGSSSTQGAMASDLAHSYPAVLQQTLSVGLPQAHIAVLNRGIGGQDATEELARLDSDVIAVHPQLVVWQVGANGALRNVDPVGFRRMVTDGVRRLQASGADVILMDNQQSPRLLATAEEPLFDQALAQVAEDTGAALFSRRTLMTDWARGGFPAAEFIAVDGLHHNDRGYLCVSRYLAQAILAGLTPHLPVTASR